MMSDAGNDYWGGNNGPIISKWDQLNLVPELLRSLSKFGYVKYVLCTGRFADQPFRQPWASQ